MNHAVKIGWFAIKIDSLEDDLEDAGLLVGEGDLVVYTNDLESAADDLGISRADITVVKRDDIGNDGISYCQCENRSGSEFDEPDEMSICDDCHRPVRKGEIQ